MLVTATDDTRCRAFLSIRWYGHASFGLYCGMPQTMFVRINGVVAKVPQHPLEMRLFGLDAYKKERHRIISAQSTRCGNEPAPETRTCADHDELLMRIGYGAQ